MTRFEEFQHNIMLACKISDFSQFVKELFLAFNIPNATIKRLELDNKITKNSLIKVSSNIQFYFTEELNLYIEFDKVLRKNTSASKTRFTVVIGSGSLLAFDSVMEDWLESSLESLYKKCDFFSPIIGIEKRNTISAQSMDQKMSEKIASIYNDLLILNGAEKKNDVDVFLVKLIECYLADGFNLIKTGSIRNGLLYHTKEDASDLDEYYSFLVYALEGSSMRYPDFIGNAINGTIGGKTSFDGFDISFNSSIKKELLNLCDFDWKNIEPEILGSIVQLIIDPEKDGVSYNYTATANIYKVIGPLFMDELYKRLKKQQQEGTLNDSFLNTIADIKIFDPSCGTGNFLITAYKELSKLEETIKTILSNSGQTFQEKKYVRVSNFLGIEKNNIAASIASIGLLFSSLAAEGTDSGLSFGKIKIMHGNALRIRWDAFCPKDSKVYIIGNPDFKGGVKTTQNQKDDMQYAFAEEIERGAKIGGLDYAATYFYLASRYIEGTKNRFAFVSTNSITQGVNASILWPILFNYGSRIIFAHTSFKWRNSSGRNTNTVTVVIIGCGPDDMDYEKTIFDGDIAYRANSISPYLTKGGCVVEERKQGPLSEILPKMVKGNMAYGEKLLLSPKEKDELCSIYPEATKFLKRAYGSKEYIHDLERWCLWISESQVDEAMAIPLIAEKIEDVKKARLGSTDASAHRLAERPYSFRETKMPERVSLVVPSVSSENRSYFQAGFLGKNCVVTNLCLVIYDAEPWVLGIIESKMHNLWVCTVCGGLETRPRYSSTLGYNTFPLPRITEAQKNAITAATLNVIKERENNIEMNLAELYGEETMPADLRYAHKMLDMTVEKCFREDDFNSDQERLDVLFETYSKMIARENTR